MEEWMIINLNQTIFWTATTLITIIFLNDIFNHSVVPFFFCWIVGALLYGIYLIAKFLFKKINAACLEREKVFKDISPGHREIVNAIFISTATCAFLLICILSKLQKNPNHRYNYDYSYDC